MFSVFSSILFAGKVITELKTEMREDILEEITNLEKNIAENLGLIKAVNKEVKTIEATVRDLPDICESNILQSSQSFLL